jgi:hypothetical protein
MRIPARVDLWLWARALGAAVAGLAVTATSTVDVPAAAIKPSPPPAPAPDPRIARLENFFQIHHCPAPNPTSEYLRAADSYGLDYRLLPALSIRETLCGRAERHQHNPWGYHHQSFPSLEAGIDFLAQRLTRHPLYRGKTLHDILFTYNPLPAYPEEIKRIMRQIE